MLIASIVLVVSLATIAVAFSGMRRYYQHQTAIDRLAAQYRQTHLTTTTRLVYPLSATTTQPR